MFTFWCLTGVDVHQYFFVFSALVVTGESNFLFCWILFCFVIRYLDVVGYMPATITRFDMDSNRFWLLSLIHYLDTILEWWPLVGLVMVVQSNFCNRDFVIHHKVSVEVRSGIFPGQSNTINFCFLKTVFAFSHQRHWARFYWNVTRGRLYCARRILAAGLHW